MRFPNNTFSLPSSFSKKENLEDNLIAYKVLKTFMEEALNNEK